MNNENIIIEQTEDPASTSDTNVPSKIGFSIASMICGILSLILCCATLISIILAIVSIVLGAIAIKKSFAGRGMSIAGVVCGIIALCLDLLYYICFFITGLTLTSLLG